MKNTFFVLVLFLSIFVWPTSAISGTKVGIVDGEKLFEAYPAAQDATKKIATVQEELRDAITESEKALGDLEKEKKPESEKLVKQRELQAKIDIKAKETKELIETISLTLEKEILNAVEKVASKKGLEVVFDKRAVLLGGVDITEEVSQELKKQKPSLSKSAAE